MQGRINSYLTRIYPWALNKWRSFHILSHCDLTIEVKVDYKWIWCLKCVRHAATGQTGPTSLQHWSTTSLSQAALCYKMACCVQTSHLRATLQEIYGEWCCNILLLMKIWSNDYVSCCEQHKILCILISSCVNSQDEMIGFID